MLLFRSYQVVWHIWVKAVLFMKHTSLLNFQNQCWPSVTLTWPTVDVTTQRLKITKSQFLIFGFRARLPQLTLPLAVDIVFFYGDMLYMCHHDPFSSKCPKHGIWVGKIKIPDFGRISSPVGVKCQRPTQMSLRGHYWTSRPWRFRKWHPESDLAVPSIFFHLGDKFLEK